MRLSTTLFWLSAIISLLFSAYAIYMRLELERQWADLQVISDPFWNNRRKLNLSFAWTIIGYTTYCILVFFFALRVKISNTTMVISVIGIITSFIAAITTYLALIEPGDYSFINSVSAALLYTAYMLGFYIVLIVHSIRRKPILPTIKNHQTVDDIN